MSKENIHTLDTFMDEHGDWVVNETNDQFWKAVSEGVDYVTLTALFASFEYHGIKYEKVGSEDCATFKLLTEINSQG